MTSVKESRTELSPFAQAAVEAYGRAIDGIPDTVDDVDGQTVADYVALHGRSRPYELSLRTWLLEMHGALTRWYGHLDTLCAVLHEDGWPGSARAQQEVARYFAADQAVKNAVVAYVLSKEGARPAPSICQEYGWELPMSVMPLSPFRAIAG